MSKPLKILVIRFSSIGDIVLTTPVIRCLKKQLNSEVHFLTKKEFFCLLENNPYVHQLHAIENGLENLNSLGFDWVIDLHYNLRTSKVKRVLGVPSKSFYKLNIEKWLLTTFKINRLPNKHIVDRFLDTVAHLGVRNDNLGLDYFLAENKSLLNRLELPEKYVALVIGGQHATKILPIDRLQEVCQQVKLPVVLIGGPEDKSRGEEIAQNQTEVFNTCGDLSINHSAFLIKHAQKVITHDTGMMHIAAAFKKKIISIWGNTVPDFGMYPYMSNKQSKILEVKNLPCRPCSKIGYKKCPKGHFKCMNQIDLSLISGE